MTNDNNNEIFVSSLTFIYINKKVNEYADRYPLYTINEISRQLDIPIWLIRESADFCRNHPLDLSPLTFSDVIEPWQSS